MSRPTTYSCEGSQPSHGLFTDRRVVITLYTAVVFLFWMAQYLYVPTLPTYAQTKTDNLAAVGFILSMYGLWQALIRIPLGLAADWLGWRKPFILIGFALAGLGAYIMGSANSADGLALGRAITGLAAGTWVPLVVAFSALFPPQEVVRASAMLSLVNALGRILATVSTGWLNAMGGYALAFYVATGVAALSVVIMLAIGETRRPPQPPTLQSFSRLLTRRDVMLPSLVSMVCQIVTWAISFGFMAVLAKQLGASDVAQSLLVTLHIAISAIGNMVTMRPSRLPTQRLIYVGFVLMFVGVGTAAFATALWVLFVATLLIGLGWGLGYPVLMGLSIRHVSDAERTTAMGVHQSVYAIGMFVGPALSGFIADLLGLRIMFVVIAAASLAAGVVGTWQLKTTT
jgi:MFS family permease